ncbi:MAG: hypothetical protein HN855_13670 [Anaerolineae bacterium]|jgi:anti-sigma factor RsiW|nr:hypothetical protein [Anaerolineae bacterium]MBT7070154.1 hypothetical protein [Anaerolineae bacterium]MBT7326204.1 hypothetical protein [Anaerolineae bacterium]
MRNDINCDAFLEELSDYVDGVLGDTLCKEIERHIEDCGNCRVVVDTLKKTIYLYHETAAQTLIPAEVRERLFHRLSLEDFIQEEK